MNEPDDRQGATIKDEAAAWVVKLNAGPLSGDDAYDFEHWLHLSDEHRREFAAHARVWQRAGSGAERARDAEPIALGGVIAAWARIHPVRAWCGFAATCALALAVGLLVERNASTTFESLAVETGIGQSERVELPDGSTVQLNTDTRIVADYSRAERAVRLEKGEGHFVVADDGSWPFRVYTADQMIEAVGTAFRVLVGEQTEVIVTEGRVRVAVLETPVDPQAGRVARIDAIVHAGRNAVFRRDGILVEPLAMAEIDRRLSWQTGGLSFDGEPLASVVREFARYNATRIVLADDIRGLKVLGWFPVGDTARFIQALEDNVGIASRTDAEGSVHLYREPPLV